MKMLLRDTLVCDDVAARYAAADAAVCVRVRMLLSDTLLRTLLYVRMLLHNVDRFRYKLTYNVTYKYVT